MIEGAPRIVVFDPRHQYAPGQYQQNELAGGPWIICRQPWHLVNVLRLRSPRTPFCVLYLPTGDRIAHLDAVARLVFAAGAIVLLVDEVQLMTTEKWMSPAMFELITTGRHRDISVIVTSQRPANVAKNITDLANVKKIFRVQGAGDLNYFRPILTREQLEILPRLPDRHYLEVHDGGFSQVVTQ